jgi:hypothetical protein
MVIPDGHDEYHSLNSGTNLLETTLSGELVGVSESCLLGGAETVGDGVTGNARNRGIGVVNGSATLDIKSLDLLQVTGCCAVGGDELGNDCEWL